MAIERVTVGCALVWPLSATYLGVRKRSIWSTPPSHCLPPPRHDQGKTTLPGCLTPYFLDGSGTPAR